MIEDAVSTIRTLRLKVKSEAYAWLSAAAIEVNTVWNFANETGYRVEPSQPYCRCEAGIPALTAAA
jgi:hypothetical protein